MDALEQLIASVNSIQAQDQSVQSLPCLEVLKSIAARHQWTLHLDGYDEEQIWAQVKWIVSFTQSKARIPLIKDTVDSLGLEDTFVKEPEEAEAEAEEDRFEPMEEDAGDEELDEGKDINNEQEGSEAEEGPKNPADDDFFKISEMEQFVAEAEFDADDPALAPNSSEASSSSEEQSADMQYSSFFKHPHEPEVEEEQERVFASLMDPQIDELEEKLVGEKPWQLRGEVTSTHRPVDSLLTENLDFQMASTAAPLTHVPEVSDELETVVKQRILDLNFDDPRVKVQVSVPERAENADFMDFEKSKKSLAELYEEDYKKDVLHIPIVTEQEAAKKEAAAIWRKLCYNLDLLASLTPVPRPKTVSEISIKPASVPAIAMEETIPFSVSQASAQPPQALYNPKSATLKSEPEFDKTDHNKIRRKSKTALRTRKKERLMRLIEKAAQDPRNEKFEYRRHMKEQKARKELLDRKKQPEHKFTRSSEFFKQFAGLREEETSGRKKRKIEQVKL